MPKKIMIVEDEEMIADSMRYNLEKAGYSVVVAQDGETALELAEQEKPDLVLLDLLLPGRDGWEVCRELRKKMLVPVIMVTARGQESDRIAGLDLGADDYIVKPFSMRELIARVRAVMRRTRGVRATQKQILEFGNLHIDLDARKVFVKGEPVELTRKEFDLLRTLSGRPNFVFERDDVLRLVWGEDFFGDSKTLDVHIRWLRGKIEEDPANPRYIQTVRGVGYMFEAPIPMADG